jgi:N12 class adenine-specific DNA methylase
VQPENLRPSDIAARLGAPWIPAADVEMFAAEMMGTGAGRRPPHRAIGRILCANGAQGSPFHSVCP